MSAIDLLLAALGPAELEFEKQARELRRKTKDPERDYKRMHATRFAESCAHECRRLARQIDSFKTARGVAIQEHDL